MADSSLREDRAVKPPLYAQAGVPDYWIVNVRLNSVEVFRAPVGDAYTEMSTYAAGDQVTLAVDPEIVVTLDLG